jgi:hypothetical protein
MDGLIHMGWAVGLAGFAQVICRLMETGAGTDAGPSRVNLSPDGDGNGRIQVYLCFDSAILSAFGDSGSLCPA